MLKVDSARNWACSPPTRRAPALARYGDAGYSERRSGDYNTTWCRADTIGVFQIESRTRWPCCRASNPAVSTILSLAIIRHSPIQRRHGASYLKRRGSLSASVANRCVFRDRELEGVLHGRTYGVLVNREQAMQLAVALPPRLYPGEADQLRRAMKLGSARGGRTHLRGLTLRHAVADRG
ncbi:MAG: hypothetical protein IPO00_17240 [Betaproteobacteria bacterium]|nr:hypothetical protein [Betaproteobacteria bacterium]